MNQELNLMFAVIKLFFMNILSIYVASLFFNKMFKTNENLVESRRIGDNLKKSSENIDKLFVEMQLSQ